MAKSGDSSSCQIMVGTPVRPLILSRSISSSASAGSQRCIRTSLPPLGHGGISTEWQPVTWKKRHGQQHGALRRVRVGAGGGSPVRRTIARAAA